MGRVPQRLGKRAAHLLRKLEGGDGEKLLSAVTRKGEVVVEGHQVGHVGGFRFRPDPMTDGESRKLVLRAARRALRESIPLRVGALEFLLGRLGFVFGCLQFSERGTRLALIAHERVVRTLRAWNIRIDEALFLGGLDKGPFLRAFGADIFFDDQRGHVESAQRHVAAGHVPYGVANE